METTGQKTSDILEQKLAGMKTAEQRVEIAKDGLPVNVGNLSNFTDTGTRWARDVDGQVAAAVVNAPRNAAILHGNGKLNRVIRNTGLPIRYTSQRISVTLHAGDIIWVPEGELYAIDPLGSEVKCEIIVWPVKEGVPLSLSRAANESQ